MCLLQLMTSCIIYLETRTAFFFILIYGEFNIISITLYYQFIRCLFTVKLFCIFLIVLEKCSFYSLIEWFFSLDFFFVVILLLIMMVIFLQKFLGRKRFWLQIMCVAIFFLDILFANFLKNIKIFYKLQNFPYQNISWNKHTHMQLVLYLYSVS